MKKPPWWNWYGLGLGVFAILQDPKGELAERCVATFAARPYCK